MSLFVPFVPFLVPCFASFFVPFVFYYRNACLSINRKVGKFTARAVITRVGASGRDTKQCYYIPYEIQDTDECSLAVGQPMRHRCHRSTVCINTMGSYECG